MSDQDTTGRPGGGDTPLGPRSTGCRVHKPEWDRARDAAEAWTGLEGGLDHWALHDLLDEDHRVRERFQLKQLHVNYLRMSFKKLRRKDFEPGDCPPSVWIRKHKLAKKLGVSVRTVSNIEKDLARAGFLYWTDTASRRRDGKRSKKDGRIKCAYGVTFAPFAAMAREIEDAKRLAEEEEIESDGLVHEIATIRCHSRIPLQAALRLDETTAPVLRPLLARVLALPDAKGMGGAHIDRLRALAVEARHIEKQVRALTEPALDAVELPIVEAVETPESASPEHEEDAGICTLGYPSATGSNSITHQFREINNLVAADQPAEPSSEPPGPPAARPSPERGTGSPSGLGRSPVSGGPPAWLILDSLSPRLGRFLPPGRPPTADEVFQAANRTRSELGISPEAWRDACTALSPAWAFMAVVVVASRDDAGEIHTSAGGYFRKLTERARKGTLNLAGSLWGVIERSEELHVARAAPATEGEPSIPGPDPGLQLRVGGRRADQATMAAACRTAADPQALLLAWRELVARYRCLPYLDEVERLYEQLLAPQAAIGAARNGRRGDARNTEPCHA